MKANELRIGNYINYQGVLQKITSIGLNTVSVNYISSEEFDYPNLDCNKIKPIPLTEEWLLKFGFIKDKIDNTFYKDDFDILLPNFLRYKQAQIYKIKHVHQLQNLYFALTQNELTIK